jgi:hypothetical protein
MGRLNRDTVATEERPGFCKNSRDDDFVLSRPASGERDEEREFPPTRSVRAAVQRHPSRALG